MPVLVIGTYNDDNTPNAMTAAWGGILDDNKVFFTLSEDHLTAKNIKNKKCFTISIGTEDLLDKIDYIGIVSGNDDKQKFNKAGFTETKSKIINAPVINEFTMILECKLIKNTEDGYYHGEILNIIVDDSVLSNNKIDYKKLKPITYDLLPLAMKE